MVFFDETPDPVLDDGVENVSALFARPEVSNASNMLQAIRSVPISDFQAASPDLPTKYHCDSVIAHCYNLLSTRQNLFGIMLAAQSGKDSDSNGSLDEEEVLSDQRAFSVVWRDPLPDTNGVHHAFTQQFRWLE
jgi:hypothetical protein